MNLTKTERYKRLAWVRYIMTMDGVASPTQMCKILKERYNLVITTKSCWELINQIRAENLDWMTDMVKTSYQQNMRDRYMMLMRAMEATDKRLQDATCKDTARSHLNNSLVTLSDQVESLVEDQGLFIYLSNDIVGPEVGEKQEDRRGIKGGVVNSSNEKR